MSLLTRRAIVGRAVASVLAALGVRPAPPPVVTAAESHADFFERNLLTLLAEERLAFPVNRPVGGWD